MLFRAKSGIVHRKSRCKRFLAGSLTSKARCDEGVPLNLYPELQVQASCRVTKIKACAETGNAVTEHGSGRSSRGKLST